MSKTVGDIGDEVQILALGTSEQTIDGLDHHLDEVDVLPFVEAADVVGLGDGALVEDEVDGTCMVFDEKPVTHVLALAIDRKWLAMTNVVDEERNQLLGELVGSVVVRAVGDDGRHAVGVVEGTHKVIRAGFRSTVGRMRIVLGGFVEEVRAVGEMVLTARSSCREGRLHALGMVHGQGAIDLIGRDVVKALALIFLGQ